MQTLFAERTDWHVPWLERVLPVVTHLAEARRERTVFTRFVPPERPEDAAGAWRRYYAHWRDMTGERLDPRLIQLVPPLAALTPPAIIIDKSHYSPFREPAFLEALERLNADALVITGGETDVCVPDRRPAYRARQLSRIFSVEATSIWWLKRDRNVAAWRHGIRPRRCTGRPRRGSRDSQRRLHPPCRRHGSAAGEERADGRRVACC